MIDNFDWSSLISDDINISWQQWQSKFTSIMQECIPKGVLPKTRHVPWITKQIRSASETYFTEVMRAKNICRSGCVTKGVGPGDDGGVEEEGQAI